MDIETQEKFITLRAKGYSFDRIAREIGRSKQTLIDWSRELQEEIASRRATEIEALQEKYYLYKEARLQAYGEILLKIREELINRDLSEVATDKLLDMYLKFSTQVKEDIIEPTFKTSGEIQEDRLEREALEELTAPARPRGRELKAG